MRLKEKDVFLLAFTAIFAVLAGFVFWGTWSLSVCPVMPDARLTFPCEGYIASVFRDWVKTGRFTPWDITSFIGSPYLWQELQYVIASYFSALALSYYLRGRSLSRIASYGAGLFLGFCGYWFTLFSAGHAGWFRWMIFGVFAFALADRAVRKGKMKNWVLLGACVAWASFYQPDLWLLFTVFTAAYFIWCCVRERKVPDWKGVAVAAVVFAVIVSPSIMNAIGAKGGREKQIVAASSISVSSSKGQSSAAAKEERWIFITNWSLPPAETAEFFIPRINGDTSCGMVLSLGPRLNTGVKPYTGALGRPKGAASGNYRQHSLYVGFITCLFALSAVVFLFIGKRGTEDGGRLSNRKEVIFFVVSAFLFWLLSMGRNFEPLYRIVFAIPIGDSIRCPVKWHHLTEFCLCVLAGYGIEAVSGKLRSLGFGKKMSEVILCLIIFFGACDLARCARLYCAPFDLSIVKNANPAAELVKRRGGGKVADFVQGARGPLSWSFGVRRVAMTADFSAADIRFVWAPVQSLDNPELSAWLKSRKASLVASYYVTDKAVREASGTTPNVVLMEIPGVPPPEKKKPLPLPINLLTYLGALSLIGTCFASVYGVKKS